MPAPKNDQLLKALKWRYATKKFDATKSVSPQDWATLEEALTLSASSFGLQLWRFYVLTDPKVKAQLPQFSWGQTQVADASHVVVFTVKKDITVADVDHYIARTAEVRGVTVESLKGYRDMMAGYISNGSPADIQAWASRQVYIALGNLLTSAALLDIDTCPMEGIDGAKYDEILGIAKDGYKALAVTPVGYRAADDKYADLPKVRFPASEVIKHI